MFCAGDASGASSHKFSSGSHAEGRIAAKAAVRYCVEHPEELHVSEAQVTALQEDILKPLDTFDRYKDKTTDVDVNPNYIRPKSFLFRLQKIMDEYAGGVSAQFTTNRQLLEKGMELLGFLKEDASKLAATDLHELMRCWENVHRMWQAEAHVRTLMFREETRWPGYYYRADTPSMDDENWKCFANCRWVPSTGEWEMIKRPIRSIFKEVSEHELLGG
jgi:adenylylsulfate reductase subunit A